jgi:hypothetical protein
MYGMLTCFWPIIHVIHGASDCSGGKVPHRCKRKYTHKGPPHRCILATQKAPLWFKTRYTRNVSCFICKIANLYKRSLLPHQCWNQNAQRSNHENLCRQIVHAAARRCLTSSFYQFPDAISSCLCRQLSNIWCKAKQLNTTTWYNGKTLLW